MSTKANKKYYLAGPMTGIPSFNIPEFDRISEELRKAGHTVVSPAELDMPEVRAASLASPDGNADGGHPVGESWGDFLSRDVKIVADTVDGVILMPGWQRSRGANLEAFVAMLCKHELYEYEETLNTRIRPITYDCVARQIMHRFVTVPDFDLAEDHKYMHVSS